VPGATGTQVDFLPFESNVSDPGAFVAQFNANVLHHSLTDAEAAAIIPAISAVPLDDPLNRARAAAYLVFASPRYQITR
jgi:hypothetical protein